VGSVLQRVRSDCAPQIVLPINPYNAIIVANLIVAKLVSTMDFEPVHAALADGFGAGEL